MKIHIITDKEKISTLFRQTWSMLKENPLVSTISVAGTALSIAMIMLVVLIFQIQFASYSPENDRDRMMYVENGTKVVSGGDWSSGGMSVETVKECFYSLKTPEAVSSWSVVSKPLSTPGRQTFKAYSLKETDPGFWKIFSFRFVEGKPFTEADFTSAIPVIVIAESVARTLYGMTDVVGKTLMVDLTPYMICGVVKDVSRAADTAYAEAWIPYTTDQTRMNETAFENMSGAFSVCLLAGNSADFSTIRQELKGEVARYNATKESAVISFYENPITRFDIAIGSRGQRKVKLSDYLAETGALLLFLLLVPAFNLLGVTQSAVQKRRAEMGVRKAFGATFGTLIRQVLYENCVITLLGGVVGLLLSFLFLPLCKDFLLKSTDTALNGDMLFQPAIFGVALLMSLLLNLLSAGIPAVRIARQPICEALNDHEN